MKLSPRFLISSFLADSGIKIIKGISRHRLVQQSGQIFFWSIVTKGIAFFASAWMIRCLQPENLGISGVVSVAVIQAGLFINLGFDIVGARDIASNKDNARSIIETIIGLRMRVCLLLITIWFLGIVFFHPPSNTLFAWLMGAPLLLVGAFNNNWIFQGLEEMPILSKITAFISLVSAAAYLLFFRPVMPAGSDLLVMIFANGVGLLFSWKFIHRKTRLSFFSTFDWQKAKIMLWNARWAFGMILVMFVYSQLDVLLLARFVDITQVGQYRCSTTMIGYVVLVIGIIPTLLYPRYAVWYKKSPELLWRYQKYLAVVFAVITFPVMIVAIFISKPLFHILYGISYNEAIIPFIILVFAKMVVLVGGVYAWGILAAGRERSVFFIESIAALVSLILNLKFIPKFGIIAAASTNAISETVVLAGCLYYAYHVFRSKVTV